MSSNTDRKPVCGSDCGHCPMHQNDGHDHTMPTQQVAGGLEGWKLGLSAGVVFLIPLLVGMAGAFFARPWGGTYQLGGFVVGAFVGIAVARLISRLFTRNLKNDSDISECPYKDQENSEK